MTGEPIEARSAHLNCILQDLSRDTLLDHIKRVQPSKHAHEIPHLAYLAMFGIFDAPEYALKDTYLAMFGIFGYIFGRVVLITPSSWFKLVPVVFVFLLVYYLRKHLRFLKSE